jgi:hypothetical protein
VKKTYQGAHMVDIFPVLDKLPDVLVPWPARARQNHALEMKVRLLLVRIPSTHLLNAKSDSV